MELNFDTRFLEVKRAAGQSRSQFTVKSKSDRSSFPNSEALQNALRQAPDVREAEVARATQLVNDPQYPPMEGIQKLAKLLAIPLQDAGDQ